MSQSQRLYSWMFLFALIGMVLFTRPAYAAEQYQDSGFVNVPTSSDGFYFPMDDDVPRAILTIRDLLVIGFYFVLPFSFAFFLAWQFGKWIYGIIIRAV